MRSMNPKFKWMPSAFNKCEIWDKGFAKSVGRMRVQACKLKTCSFRPDTNWFLESFQVFWVHVRPVYACLFGEERGWGAPCKADAKPHHRLKGRNEWRESMISLLLFCKTVRGGRAGVLAKAGLRCERAARW